MYDGQGGDKDSWTGDACEIKNAQLKYLVELSGITKSQLLGYLRLLIKMNLIVKSGRNYQYNSDIKQWRIPNRR